MPGLVGVPCSDSGRYSAFTDSLANLKLPEGSSIRMAISTWRHKARNQLAEWMFEINGEWLFMVDDDHTFDPNLLLRLLAHNVEIVAALAFQRAEPYAPFCFEQSLGDGVYRTIDLSRYGAELVQVAAVGTGAMLIRRSVFERLPSPWFSVTSTSGEDMLFCEAATAAGIPVHCDLGSPVGHLTTTAVIPARTERGWKVGFLISDETRLMKELPPPSLWSA